MEGGRRESRKRRRREKENTAQIMVQFRISFVVKAVSFSNLLEGFIPIEKKKMLPLQSANKRMEPGDAEP